MLLRVQRVSPAITPQTSFAFAIDREGVNRDVVDNLAVLVSNPGEGDGDFAVLSVDADSGAISGLQRGGEGSVLQISTGSSSSSNLRRSALHARKVEKSERNFTCGVDHDDHNGDHHHEMDEQQTLLSDDARSFVPPTASRNAPRQDTITINLLVAVDADFINRQGSTNRAIKYVNFLISSANAIYEPELGVRLNVVRVEETDIFDGANDDREGLRTMRLHYEGKTVVGNEVNLVHAMLGRNLGGGIAFIGKNLSNEESVLFTELALTIAC